MDKRHIGMGLGRRHKGKGRARGPRS